MVLSLYHEKHLMVMSNGLKLSIKMILFKLIGMNN